MSPERTYHFYNHANGWEKLFTEERNYPFFLEKLEEYIQPIAKLYAYCLIPDHFHLVDAIRSEKELLEVFKLPESLAKRPKKLRARLKKKISQAFSNCFNSYAQSFNKVYSRKGSLFMQNFRKDGREQFLKYHQQPVDLNLKTFE